MENPNYKIDEIFRQRLHDAEVPPPPFVWPAVEQALKKRRRRLMFVWLFAFGTVAASVWLWQSNMKDREDQSQTLAPVAKLPNNVQATDLTSLPEPSQINLNETNTNDSAPGISVPSGAETLVSTTPKGNGTTTYHNTENPQNSKETASKILSKENIPAEISSLLPEGNAEPTKLLNATDLQEAGKKESVVSFSTVEINGLQSVVSLSNKKKAVQPQYFKSRSRRKREQPKVCYDFARHPSAWLLDLYAGPSLAQRSLTSRLDDVPYLNQRLATEQRSVAMNAGLRASLMFNSNFLVRTGLHYDQVTEVFEYIDPTTVIYRLQFTPGNPIPDTLGVEYGENYLKTYNRYVMLDVPLMVGVEMRHGRSGFSINAGVSANVLFQKRGAVIDPLTHEPARFGPISDVGPKTGLSQDVFRTNVGLSATASIQWYWHLSSHFRLFVEPSFRQVLRPVTVASHPVEQRYSILGLRLGATKIF